MPNTDFQEIVVLSDEECVCYSTRLWDLMGEIKDIPYTSAPNEGYFETPLGRAHCPVHRYDIHRILEIFDHLQIEPEYVLDYAYLYGEWGGRPVLFTRIARSEEITSTEDFQRLSVNVIRHLTFDRTTLGFLQRALLMSVGDQLNLNWQEGFGENQLLLTFQDLEQLMIDLPEHGWEDYQKKLPPNHSALHQYMNKSGVGRAVRSLCHLMGQDSPWDDLCVYSWTPEEREAHSTARLQKLSETIHLNPTIRQIDENNAEVTCVVFETFGGLFYKSVVVTWPNSVSEPVYEPIMAYSLSEF